MKNIAKFLIAAVGVILVFSACHKEPDLPVYLTGNGCVVTGSAGTVAATLADSSKSVFTVNWTWPNYATDSANQKFIVQIDSAGRNFATPFTKTVFGVVSNSFTAKQLNDIVFGFGAVKSEPYSLDVRIISSYANNNELYKSNTVNVKVTPYIVPVTLAVNPAGPLTLLMADAAKEAISCTWNGTKYGNQVLNYAIQFQKDGGDWTTPYVKTFNSALLGSFTVTDLNRIAISAGILPNATGTLNVRVVAYQGADFANPLYSNVKNFTVTTYLDVVKFWVVGGYNSWGNNDNAEFLLNTSTSGSLAEGYVNFPTSGEFKLTTDHSWDDPHTFGDDGSNSGKLKNPGGNIAVAPEGYYFIQADLMAMTYSLTKTVWGTIGTATAGGWDAQTDMVYDPTTKTFTWGGPLKNSEFKFRGTPSWSLNYGAAAGSSALVKDGPNIAVDLAADYFISLDLSHPTQYTYTCRRWGLIGSATPDGWNSDQNMTWDPVAKAMKITLNLTAGEIKFRANDSWDYNLGGDVNSLEPNGPNIAVGEAGNYTITLYLSGTPHCTVVKN